MNSFGPLVSLNWEQQLKAAELAARNGDFDRCLTACNQIVSAEERNAAAILNVGALLSAFGFLRAAERCFESVLSLTPAELGAVVNLANLARDAAEHHRCRALYSMLLERLPHHPVIRRNALVTLE